MLRAPIAHTAWCITDGTVPEQSAGDSQQASSTRKGYYIPGRSCSRSSENGPTYEFQLKWSWHCSTYLGHGTVENLELGLQVFLRGVVRPPLPQHLFTPPMEPQGRRAIHVVPSEVECQRGIGRHTKMVWTRTRPVGSACRQACLATFLKRG